MGCMKNRCSGSKVTLQKNIFPKYTDLIKLDEHFPQQQGDDPGSIHHPGQGLHLPVLQRHGQPQEARQGASSAGEGGHPAAQVLERTMKISNNK